jgi:ABC-type multidrug transport system fused ATPase/permease subunit
MSPTTKAAEPLPEVRSAQTLAKLLALYGPVRWAAAAAFALYVARTVCDLSVSWLLGQSIGLLATHEGGGGPMPEEFVEAIWLMAVVMVSRTALLYFAQLASAATAQKVEGRLRASLFAKVTSLRFAYHDENRSGKTIARSLRDMEKAKLFFREVAFGYLDAILVIVGVLVLTFAAHWTYGVAVGAVVLAAFALTVRLGMRIARMDRVVSDDYDKVSVNLQENVAGARVVRAFGREPEESAKFAGSLGTFTSSWKTESNYWTGLSPWIGSVFPLAYPLILAIGAWRVGHGQSGLGDIMSVLFAARLVTYRLRPITRLVILGQEAVASASRVFEVLERRDVIAPPARRRTLPPVVEGGRGGDLVLEDVHFSHPKRASVLRGVSLHVPAGSSLGILGPTGSGKTSLVHLLPRFYDPTSGRILLDGVDLQDLDVRELRRAVGLVFQEPFLFSATVADNIAYGAPDASPERIVACAKLAAAHDFVAALPKGYETVIGERGVSLSGGQRQRLTIARALAMDPRVLIFDDATASVDAVTERELFDGIRAAARGRTTLVISQRVTSLKWCDRVAVLEAGRVTAVGTHAELVARSDLYRDVLRHQQLTGAMA